MDLLCTQHIIVILFWIFNKGNSTDVIEAQCDVLPSSGIPVDQQEQVRGIVSFSQEVSDSTVVIKVNLSGFNTSDTYTSHGFHVHETGNVSGGCYSTGGHYNPTGVNHGGKTATIRHVGDLGNIEEDSQGKISLTMTDSKAVLIGSVNIIGRAIVIHKKSDDLGIGGDTGSTTSGNAGERIACCIIQRTNSSTSLWISNILLYLCSLIYVFS